MCFGHCLPMAHGLSSASESTAMSILSHLRGATNAADLEVHLCHKLAGCFFASGRDITQAIC